MGIYTKFVGVMGAALLASATIASAATLSVSGGAPGVVPPNYNPTTATGVLAGDAVTRFQAVTDGGSVGGGLMLAAVGKTKVTITYLGKEAAAQNFTVETVGGDSLDNKNSMIGQTVSFVQNAGAVAFAFVTLAYSPFGAIENDGISSHQRLSFGLTKLSDKSYVAMFDDANGGTKAGDRDLDDMVVRIDVQAVPLPAGGVLLLTGLAGLMAARRRKSA